MYSSWVRGNSCLSGCVVLTRCRRSAVFTVLGRILCLFRTGCAVCFNFIVCQVWAVSQSGFCFLSAMLFVISRVVLPSVSDRAGRVYGEYGVHMPDGYTRVMLYESTNNRIDKLVHEYRTPTGQLLGK